MDNEPTSEVVNADNIDTDLPVNVNSNTDNISRHSSRLGSARSGRSKAQSVREATAIDGSEDQKSSGTAATPPNPEITTNGDRHLSAVVKSKRSSPVVPVFDTPSGEYDDDGANQDEPYVKSDIEYIVSLIDTKIEMRFFFRFKYSMNTFINLCHFLVWKKTCGQMKYMREFVTISMIQRIE